MFIFGNFNSILKYEKKTILEISKTGKNQKIMVCVVDYYNSTFLGSVEDYNKKPIIFKGYKNNEIIAKLMQESLIKYGILMVKSTYLKLSYIDSFGMNTKNFTMLLVKL